MKDIKFRIWDIKTEQMYFVKMIDFITHEIIASKTDKLEDLIQLSYDSSDFRILMQFTGLLDKNEKEVYEGDIVMWKNYNKHIYYEVYYNNKTACWHAKPMNDLSESESYVGGHKMEVIGNIHENINVST